MLFKRFKRHDPNPMNVYMALDKKCNQLVGSELMIVWMDDRHWKLVGTTAVLQMVWWLQVEGSFLGIPKGIYEPILNIEFSNPYGLNTIQCELYLISEDGSQDLLVSFAFTHLNMSNNGLQALKIPMIHLGQYKGAADYFDLKFCMKEYDSMNMVCTFYVQKIFKITYNE